MVSVILAELLLKDPNPPSTTYGALPSCGQEKRQGKQLWCFVSDERGNGTRFIERVRLNWLGRTEGGMYDLK